MNRGMSGLTLVEIMIVLIILAIVMATIGSRIIGSGDKAKAQLTVLKMEQLKADIEQFQLRYNSLPSSLEDLVSCGDKTGSGCLPITEKESLEDAWGTQMTFQSSGRTYKITSLGADGQSGGSGADADITVDGP